MRLPSMDRLAASAAATARRFPTVIAAAALVTTAGLVLIEDPGGDRWERILVVATLALPATFALAVTAERRRWGATGRLAALAVIVVGLLGFYLAWPGWSEAIRLRRYLQLSAGLHLAAAFLPHLGVDEPRGFWQYNRSLFLRFLTAALYVVVLQAGLSLALAALDQLFGVNVPGETYLRLWIVLGSLFQTWFFLAGVPEDFAALDRSDEYPRGLQLFTQYVLVPLVVVYLSILTAYAVKVVATWDWPSGWIGWLVSSVAVVGILAYLLVHPVRDRAENRWVRVYGRWFWIASLPSVVLLGLAIWQRIAQYGVTEDRYFLAAGAVWLGAIAVYFALTRSEDLERIPQTLCVVALVTFLGPWSAYAVSERSQRDRLRGVLAANGMLVDGRARPAPREVSFEDRTQISATVSYLLERHGERSLAPLFGDTLPASSDRTEPRPGADAPATADEMPEASGPPTARSVVASLGVDYVDRWEVRQRRRHVGFHAGGEPGARRVSGYERLVRNVSSHLRDTLTVPLDPLGAEREPLRILPDPDALRILRGGRTVLRLDVAGLARELQREGVDHTSRVAPERMWIEASGGGVRAALWLESLTGESDAANGGRELVVRQWSGLLLVGGAEVGREPDTPVEQEE